VFAPDGFAEPIGGSRNCGKRRCSRRIDEQPASTGKIDGDSAARVDTAARPIDVYNANDDAANPVNKSSQCKRQPASRIFPQGLGCFDLAGTNQ
jgi:hypothetical protein